MLRTPDFYRRPRTNPVMGLIKLPPRPAEGPAAGQPVVPVRDPATTLAEITAAARAHLPGATVRRPHFRPGIRVWCVTVCHSCNAGFASTFFGFSTGRSLKLSTSCVGPSTSDRYLSSPAGRRKPARSRFAERTTSQLNRSDPPAPLFSCRQ